MSRLVRLAPLAVLALVLTLVPGSVGAAQRARWDTRVFSRVPMPAFPAYVYQHPNGRVYAGTYTNPNGDKIRSRVFEWTASGTLLRSWTLPGQNLNKEHGVQVATSDARGRLVLLEKSTSAVLTLNIKTGRFKRQATLPDLPICSKHAPPCSPNQSDGPAIPNYATWGPGGALYVTDYGQAVIWRIPAKGGTPKVWLASKALDGIEFGTTGIVYQPRTRTMLIGQQTSSNLLANPFSGRIYRLTITSSGRPARLTTLWRSRAGALPDGFGISRSGHIYVANLLINQVVELAEDGRELDRFPHTTSGSNGSSVPFDGPSNATFVGTRILVANQSPILGTAEHLVILDVEVGEYGAPRYLPKVSTLA